MKSASFERFGEFFKAMRHKKSLSLRKFCHEHGLDPGNISKIERGLASPPSSHRLLEKYASYLGIKENSNEWYEFFDLAAACSGKLPAYMMSNEQVVNKLPLVFRTLRGQKLEPAKLEELVELIRKS